MSLNTSLSRGAICLLSENDVVPSCADKYSVDTNRWGERFKRMRTDTRSSVLAIYPTIQTEDNVSRFLRVTFFFLLFPFTAR